MLYRIRVNMDNSLTCTNANHFVANSFGLDKIKVVFKDESWSDLGVKVIFKNTVTNVKVEDILDENNECYVPFEVLKHSDENVCNLVTISLIGTGEVNGRNVRVTTFMPKSILLIKSGELSGDTPLPPSAS